jgi:hypothetical protein
VLVAGAQHLATDPSKSTTLAVRLVAAFDFRRQVVFIKFVGTHAEYDRIDALTVSQF